MHYWSYPYAQLEFIIATITLLACPFVVSHMTRILKDSNSLAGTTWELHSQQYSWHSSNDTAKIKSLLREYLAAQAQTGSTQQAWWHHRYFFLVLKHSRIMRESYFVKFDVLQSVLPWFICFGCVTSLSIPCVLTHSLIFSQWRISIFLVIIWERKKKIPDTSSNRTTPYWLSKGKIETAEFWHCVIWSLSVSVSSLTYLCNGSNLLSYLVLELISLVIILSGFW